MIGSLLQIDLFGLRQSHGRTFCKVTLLSHPPLTLGGRWLMWIPISKIRHNFWKLAQSRDSNPLSLDLQSASILFWFIGLLLFYLFSHIVCNVFLIFFIFLLIIITYCLILSNNTDVPHQNNNVVAAAAAAAAAAACIITTRS